MTVGYYAIQTWMFEQLTKVFSILLTPSLRKFSSAFPLSNLQRGMDPSLHSKFNQIHFLQLIDLIYCSFPSQFAGGERVWAEKSSVNNGSINRRNNWGNFFFLSFSFVRYGYFGSDTAYLIHLRDKMVESGAVEMFFTSDSPAGVGDRGSIPGVLQTANFNNGPDSQFDALVISTFYRENCIFGFVLIAFCV